MDRFAPLDTLPDDRGPNGALELTRDSPFQIILNAASGSGDAHRLRADLEAILNEKRQAFRVWSVDNPSDTPGIAASAAAAAQRDRGAVIVAGGDGTINTVAEHVLPTQRPFGIVPQGTFNYTSRAHGIPLDPREATAALVGAQLKAIQVGQLNGRPFLVNASLGLYPDLLQDREAFKRQYGRNRWVALGAALVTLMKEPRQWHLRLERAGITEVVKTCTLFVGNNGLQLEQVGLPDSEALQHGRLAAVMVRPIGTPGLFSLVLRGALGQLGDSENLRTFAFDHLTVDRPIHRRQRPIKVATDGEVWWAAPPIRFSVIRTPLHLMLPRATPAS